MARTTASARSGGSPPGREPASRSPCEAAASRRLPLLAPAATETTATRSLSSVRVVACSLNCKRTLSSPFGGRSTTVRAALDLVRINSKAIAVASSYERFVSEWQQALRSNTLLRLNIARLVDGNTARYKMGDEPVAWNPAQITLVEPASELWHAERNGAALAWLMRHRGDVSKENAYQQLLHEEADSP